MSITVELPDAMTADLARRAKRDGKTPGEFIADFLQRQLAVETEAPRVSSGADDALLDELTDRLSDGRPWPKTPEEIAAFLVEMDETPGLEISDEEYAQLEAERHARKAEDIAANEARMTRLSSLAP